MKIGFAAPVSGSWATYDNLLRVATRAEELGYHELWTFQRLLSPVEGEWGEAYRSVLDPLVSLGFLAAATSRIRLGVAVLNMPFASPALLAKQLSTVDILSRGRLDIGLGNGWAPIEYEASGVPLADQGRRADEYLTVLAKLFTDAVVEHEGEFYRIPASVQEPRPVQRPYPPILLGGSAPGALRRAGRRCAGWVSSSRADLGTIAAAVATVRSAAAKAGRDPDTLRFVCRGAVKVRPAAGTQRAYLTGSVEQIRGDLASLAEVGITEFFVDLNFDPLVGSPGADPTESMRRADEALDGFAPA